MGGRGWGGCRGHSQGLGARLDRPAALLRLLSGPGPNRLRGSACVCVSRRQRRGMVGRCGRVRGRVRAWKWVHLNSLKSGADPVSARSTERTTPPSISSCVSQKGWGGPRPGRPLSKPSPARRRQRPGGGRAEGGTGGGTRRARAGRSSLTTRRQSGRGPSRAAVKFMGESCGARGGRGGRAARCSARGAPGELRRRAPGHAVCGGERAGGNNARSGAGDPSRRLRTWAGASLGRAGRRRRGRTRSGRS